MRTAADIDSRLAGIMLERCGNFHKTCTHLRKAFGGHMWADSDQQARSLATVFRDLRHGLSYDREPDVRVTLPLVEAITSKFMALLSPTPQINMLTPPVGFAGLRKEETCRSLAVQNERYLYGTWEQNRISSIFKAQAYFLPLLGCAFVGVHPDFDKKNIKLLVRSPEYAFPLWDEYHRYLEEIYFKWEVPIEIAKDRWGSKVADILGSSRMTTMDVTKTSNSRRTIDVIEFYDKDSKVTVIAGREVASVKHNLGYVPWVMPSFYYQPDEDFGRGVIEGNMNLFQQMNMLHSMELQNVIENVFARLVLINPAMAPETIDNAPGAIIPIGEGGDAKWLVPPGVTKDLSLSLQRDMDMVQRGTHMPDSMFGNSPTSSVTTGKAQSETMMPTGNMIDYVQSNIADAWIMANEMMIDMAGNIFKDREIEDLYGRQFSQGYLGGLEGGKPFVISLQGADLQGWSRHLLYFGPQMDMHEKVVMGLQLAGGGLVSKTWQMKQIGISDPDQMKEEILQEQMADLQLQAWLGQAQQGLLDPTRVESNFLALEKGQMPQNAQMQQQQPVMPPGMMGPPGAPTGALPSGAPGTPPEGGFLPPVAGPNGVPPGSPIPPGIADVVAAGHDHQSAPAQGTFTLDGAIGDFQKIQKIKGRVFLMGEIVQKGATDHNIEVGITNPIDKTTIINGLPDDYHGELDFHVMMQEPTEPHVEVTPGSAPSAGGGPVAPSPDEAKMGGGAEAPEGLPPIFAEGKRNPPLASAYPAGGPIGPLHA